MQILKNLFNFYLNSSIHVALSVYALARITLLEFGVFYDVPLLYFIFFASITGYNFVKYFGVAKFHHRRLTIGLKAIQVFSFFSFIGMCYYATQLHIKTILYIAGFAAVTFFYAIPLLPKRFFLDSNHNLRSISGLKIYVIALVWTGVTVFLPLVHHEYVVDIDVVLTSIQRYAYIMVLMLPFEIRDLRYDNLKLSTIPQKIGIYKTKLLGCLLLICFLSLEFFKTTVCFNSAFIVFAVTICAFLFLIFCKRDQGTYYSWFWVESIPIFWFLLMLLFN